MIHERDDFTKNIRKSLDSRWFYGARRAMTRLFARYTLSQIHANKKREPPFYPEPNLLLNEQPIWRMNWLWRTRETRYREISLSKKQFNAYVCLLFC